MTVDKPLRSKCPYRELATRFESMLHSPWCVTADGDLEAPTRKSMLLKEPYTSTTGVARTCFIAAEIGTRCRCDRVPGKGVVDAVDDILFGMA